MFSKEPYELSVWEDVLNFRVDFYNQDGSLAKTEDYERSLASFTNPENYKTKVTQFYKEKKLCIIGSDSMSTPIRAFKTKLVQNVNGSSTLTFQMFYQYWDEEANVLINNPYVKFLTNERKLKLRTGAQGTKNAKWFDFVIKNIVEDSNQKIFSYTAKDQFINELSKTGFNIELNADLENNQGTIIDLANTILEGSDWQIPKDFDINLEQTKDEPLYVISLNHAIEAYDMRDTSPNKQSIHIPSNAIIYGFYSSINEKDDFFQFVYREDGKYKLDEKYVIINSQNLYVPNTSYVNGKPDFAKTCAISDKYRGKKLVRKQLSKYDPVLDKYVLLYKHKDDLTDARDVYGFEEIEYISPVTVNNLVTNSQDFESLSGWGAGGSKTGEGVKYPTLELAIIPDVLEQGYIQDEDFISALKVTFTDSKQTLCNSGLRDNRVSLKGLTKGSSYVCQVKAGKISNDRRRVNYGNIPLAVSVWTYELNQGVYSKKQQLLNFSLQRKGDYLQGIAKVLSSLSYEEMLKTQIGIFIESTLINETFYVEELNLFQEVYDANNILCVPGQTIESGIKTRYKYYYPPEKHESPDSVKFLYDDYKPSNQFLPQYNDQNGYEKIRSVTASESNRFNLIQDLCELFECWAKFTIEHNEQTGEILLDGNNRPKKWVTFHKYVGHDNYIGFKYGINLKDIKRTIDSNAIVSKIVVKQNSNQHATDGFCTIARAKENPTGENFLYDFSYYVNQGLIGFNEINNDLYLDSNGYLGYYKKLKAYSVLREQWIKEASEIETKTLTTEASVQTYTASVTASENQKKELEIDLQRLTGFTFFEIVNAVSGTKAYEWKENDEVKSKCAAISRLTATLKTHNNLLKIALETQDKEKKKLADLEKKLKDQKKEKLLLERAFYQKYSRFIQEGSWISEDYIDDNLYYLDAESTLHISSQPKVTYSINVLELSSLPEYESYIFSLGDKTYIEDTEFFGYQWIDGIKTPVQEEIIISEIITNLDDPSENIIKVQNYKTQFEDLFQRITATTQAVEYASGRYDKITEIITPGGELLPGPIQNSLVNNSLIISNAKDQSVVWDNTGITATNLTAPNEMLRIVSGGLFISNDGGVTWQTGITGKGINASYITSGQLDTSLIRIMNGNFPSFSWDKTGINAYEFTIDEKTLKPKNFNYSKFIRYDQYGLYGIKGYANFDPTIKKDGEEVIGEDKIWKYADFALTWKGFSIKSTAPDGHKGHVSLTSNQDFQVFNDEEKEQIKIGYLSENLYGIRISDKMGNPVLQSDSEGKLFLNQYLRITPKIDGYKDRVQFGILKSYITEKVAVLSETSEGIGEAYSKVMSITKAANGAGVPKIPTSQLPVEIFNNRTEALALYDDGTLIANSLRANNAIIEGTIYASGGKIGDLTIGEVESGIQQQVRLKLVSENGFILKIDSNGASAPTALLLKAKPTGYTITDDKEISWFGSTDRLNWGQSLKTGREYSLEYKAIPDEAKENGTFFIKVVHQDKEGNQKEDIATINIIQESESPFYIVIESTEGMALLPTNNQTELKAHLYRGNTELTGTFPYSSENFYHWKKYNRDGTQDTSWGEKTGLSITVSHLEVVQKAKFTCEFDMTTN